MYNYRYLNKHVQFGYVNYTLIIEDLENLDRPSFRIEKCFKEDDHLLDAEFLYSEARKEILRILSESEMPQKENAIIEEVIEE